MSKNQSGPTCTLRMATVKRGPRSTVKINSYGLHYRPVKMGRIWHHIGVHRSAHENESFHSMLEGPRGRAVCQSLHERDSQATRTTTRYHHRQGDTIDLRPMERNYGEIRNRTKGQHSLESTNRWTNWTNQCYIGIISTSIYQLLTRRLVWLAATGRIHIQERLSRNQ